MTDMKSAQAILSAVAGTDPFAVPMGQLPEAPLSMPKQVLEVGGGIRSRIRALFVGPLGRAET